MASDEPHGFSFLIEFAFDSTEILPESQPYLDLVGDLLASEEAKGRSIDIVGHADARGPANYNQKLSQARAEAVRSYLSRLVRRPARPAPGGRTRRKSSRTGHRSQPSNQPSCRVPGLAYR